MVKNKCEMLQDAMDRAAAGRVAWLESDGEWGYMVLATGDKTVDAVAAAVEALLLMPNRPYWY